MSRMHGVYQPEIAVPSECPRCGKVRYLSKAAAKRAAKRITNRSGRLHAYACGVYWHLGHMPSVVKTGKKARDELVNPKRGGRG